MGEAYLVGRSGATDASKINLTQDTADLYGLTGDDANVDVALARGRKWQLLQEYKTAGTYNWTAPDLFNGEDYEIGVWMCDGGQGGAASALNTATTVAYEIRGGVSGVAKMLFLTIHPGDIIAVVVGAKGNGGLTQTSDGFMSARGDLGGSTSFNGILTTSNPSDRYLLSGGVLPALFSTNVGVFYNSTSVKTLAKYLHYSPCSNSLRVNNYWAYDSYSNGFNIFDGKYYLASGGTCYVNYNKTNGVQHNFYQKGAIVSDGSSGDSNWSNTPCTASNATGVGCGGGAAIALFGGGANPYYAKGGDGGVGAVFIYV